MAEYIKREDAIMAANHAWAKCLEPSQYIEIIPSADVAPVVHAKWIHNDEWWEFICTHCHKAIENIKRYQYCPHCGAKMDLEEQK